MAVFDEKWQEANASITKRVIFMFNNDLLSDVSLVVRSSSDEGDEPMKSKMAIPAHKFVLAPCSPVFFAMFCGEMAERTDSVDLPDCEYEGVLEMLRYMYGGKSELNESNVMQVLYVAKKYMVNSLAEQCLEFLQKKLNPGNVFCVLPHAQQYDEKILVDQCWELIDRETEEAVKSEEFPTIERCLLEEIVKRDSLTIREIELFKAVDAWATKECERQGLSADGNIKREILGEKIVKEIRFPAMKENEFAKVVLRCEILTAEELIGIMKFFNSVESPPVGFPVKKRAGTFLSCCRFGDTLMAGTDALWSYDDYMDIDNLNLKVDKDISLHGVRMFGSEDNDYVLILKIVEIKDELTIVSTSGMFSSVHMQSQSTAYYGFDMLFKSPVVLKKGTKYSFKALIDGPTSSYGVDCHRSVKSHGVTFSFSKHLQDKVDYRTDAECGQFAEFLFRQVND